MTNRIAFGIGVLVVAVLALDWALGLGIGLFLARKFLDLIRIVAIWR